MRRTDLKASLKFNSLTLAMWKNCKLHVYALTAGHAGQCKYRMNICLAQVLVELLFANTSLDQTVVSKKKEIKDFCFD